MGVDGFQFMTLLETFSNCMFFYNIYYLFLSVIVKQQLTLQVLFYLSPVNRLVGTLMTVLSLFPGRYLYFINKLVEHIWLKNALDF